LPTYSTNSAARSLIFRGQRHAFSLFHVLCEDPPLCMSAVNMQADGRIQDTAAS
jgi:hypothetical protein